LDKSSAQHEIRCFSSDQCSAVSNNFFQPTAQTAFPKFRCRDIVAFRTKNSMDENFVIDLDLLQTSRFPL